MPDRAHRVLVIEDEDDLRLLIADIMELEGFDVATAANGRLGIEQARAHTPDLILCDVMMPDVDGYGVLRAIRAEPTLALVPFLFLTAKAERASVRHGMALGADDYLTKPFDVDELVHAVRTRLAKYDAVKAAHGVRLQALHHTLSATLPHELRTPLVGIIGLAELLRDSFTSMSPDLVRDLLNGICESGWRLERLVDNITLHAQFNALGAAAVPPLSPTETGCALHDILHDVAFQQAQAADRLDDLMLDLAPAHSAIRHEHFAHAFREVVDNGFKFSSPGTLVKVTGRLSTDGYAVTIRDHGRGLTAEQIAAIGPYVQFERAYYEQQGMGIGLVLARQILDAYGGSLTLESQPGVGTTVHLQIPALQATPVAAIA